MKQLSLLLLVISLLTSCSSKDKEKKDFFSVLKKGLKHIVMQAEDVPIEKCSEENKIKCNPKMSELRIDSLRFAKLCPGEDVLIGAVNKVILFKEKLYVLDKQSHSILICSKNGSFLNKICKMGKGKGEYIKLSDFAIDEKNEQIIVCDVTSRKLIYYNLDGTFGREVKILYWVKEFTVLPSGELLFLTLGNNFTGYKLLYSDAKGKIIKKAISTTTNYHLNFFSTKIPLIRQYNGEILISMPFENKFYSIESDSIIEKYILDFGDNEFIYDPKIYSNMELFMSALNESKEGSSFTLGGLIETDKHVLINFSEKNRASGIVKSKISQNVSKLSFELLKDKLYLPFPQYSEGDKLVSIIGAEWLVNNTDVLIEKYGQEEFFKSLTISSNPVLVYYTINNF